MSAATMNEMERLRRERDEAFIKGKQVFDDLRRVEAERDALSAEHAEMDQERSRLRLELMKSEKREQALEAHVERLCEHIRNDDELLPVKWAIRAHKLMDSAPTTSLAHLKAEWQAEALEEAVELYGHAWKDEFAEVVVDIMRKGRGYIYPEGLTERATELRRQAEESTNGHH